MALRTTERVEAAPWRSQAGRTSQAPRAADPARPRFDEMLGKGEAAKQGPPTADRASSDRRDTSDRDRTQATASPNPPAKARSDAAVRAAKDKPVRGDGAPQAPGAEAAPGTPDKPGSPDAAKVTGGEATDGQVSDGQVSDGKVSDGKVSDGQGGDAQTAAAGMAVPTVVPGAPPVPPAATPVPTAAASSTPAGDGAQVAGATSGSATSANATSAGALRGGTAPATPAGETDAEDAGESGKADAVSKDFLATLSGGGQDPSLSPGPDLSQITGQDAGALPGSPAGAIAALPAQALSPAGGTTGAAPATAAASPAPPAIPIGQVPMTIGLRSLSGSSEFQIRLDPVELGRIEVKLEIDKAKGTVFTHLTVDRPDTLALLQRDAGQLQQALTQAGLDPGAGGVNVSLRHDGGQQAGGQGGQPGGDTRPNSPWSADRADTLAEAVPVQRLRGYGGLDIRI